MLTALILVATGLALALLFKGAGRLNATLFQTDPTSAKWTVVRHFGLAGRLFMGAVLCGLLVIIAFLVPPHWALWVVPIGLGILVLLNVCLGGLAGTISSLGKFLSRSRYWDDLEHQIAMKERARNVLRRLSVIAMLTQLGLAPEAWPGDACGIALDRTASLRASSRAHVLSFLKATVVDYVETMDCASVTIIELGSQTRFAKRTWLEVVRQPVWIDCSTVEPAALGNHAGLFNWAPNVKIARKRDTVAECERTQAAARAEYEAELLPFRNAFESALAVPRRVEYSRIKDLIDHLIHEGLYRHLVVVSDLLDNPPASLEGLMMPEEISVLMVAVEPDPDYGTPEAVLARAREWEGVGGVTVVTAAELHPMLWATLSKE